MKKILYLSLFLLIGSFNVKANGGYYGVNGFYINGNDYSEIQIKEYRNGIKVRGLNWKRPNNWIKFERINKKQFIDCDDNRMILKRNRQGNFAFVFKDRYGSRVQFRRVNSYGTVGDQHYDNSYGYYDNRNGWRKGRDRHNTDRNRSQYRFNDRSSRHNESNVRLEGTYTTRDGRSIAIVETRRGFKAKFSGERTWKSYEEKNGRFVDKDGNSYAVQKGGDLIWNGKYSGKKIRLTKSSDKVSY